MYVLWANGQGVIINGRWIIGLLNKADKLGLNAYVEKLEDEKITKIYKRENGKVKCIND